jgi:uncharacterized membrane protein YkvA (DUF1232 family)
MSWSDNILQTIKSFGGGKKVNNNDEGLFTKILKNFFAVGEIQALFHLATFRNPDCAKRIFSAADLAIVVAAVAYVIFPFDAIPDFIPITGLLDDVGVVNFVLNRYGEKIRQYRENCM